MKFIHIADTHLDSAFNFLTNKADLGDIRRMDQRKTIKKMIDYAKENNIKYIFIAGDFYENSSIRESTVEYINNLFKEIPDTKIYITPGNHDPLTKNSYYLTFNWAENVKIFSSKIEKIEEEEFDLYGYGFDDFFMNHQDLNKLKNKNDSKINILITHSSLDGSKELNEYNPITTKELNDLKFDYVALGHIHKLNLENENQSIIYPGSTCSLGFDELGEHGMIVGEINKNEKGETNRNIKFIPLDSKEFIREECDISNMNSMEDIADYMNGLKTKNNKYYEIILIGNRKFEISKYTLYKLIENENIIKIKDTTKLGLDLEEIEKETSLRGIFVRKMKEKMDKQEIDQDLIEKAIEYGLQSLSGK